MNNTINATRNDVCFRARYIHFHEPSKIPNVIKDAILKSDAVDKFIKADKKKSLWKRFLDLFRNDEILEIRYTSEQLENYKTNKDHCGEQLNRYKTNKDPYGLHNELSFRFGRTFNDIPSCIRSYKIEKEQHGIFKNKLGIGRILRHGENPYFDKPAVTADEQIAKSVLEIQDLDKLLK